MDRFWHSEHWTLTSVVVVVVVILAANYHKLQLITSHLVNICLLLFKYLTKGDK